MQQADLGLAVSEHEASLGPCRTWDQVWGFVTEVQGTCDLSMGFWLLAPWTQYPES